MTALFTRRVLPALLVLLVLLPLVASCAAPTSPAASSSASPSAVFGSPLARSTRTGRPGIALPAPAAVNWHRVDAVTVAAAVAVASSDTTLDNDPNDTLRRQGGWLTPGFLAAVQAYPPVSSPGAAWALWASHRAYLHVTATLGTDEHPVDTATAAYRQVIQHVTAIGRDRWRGPTTIQVAHLTLAPVAGVWRVASYQAE